MLKTTLLATLYNYNFSRNINYTTSDIQSINICSTTRGEKTQSLTKDKNMKNRLNL